MTSPQHGIFAEADEIKFEGDAMLADSLVSGLNKIIDGVAQKTYRVCLAMIFPQRAFNFCPSHAIWRASNCNYSAYVISTVTESKTGLTNLVRRSRGRKVPCRRKTIWQRR